MVRFSRARGTALILAAVVTLGSLACGGDGPGAPSGSGSLSARVDGSNWSANSGILALRVNNFISVTGSVGGTTNITFAFPDEGTGTYSIPAAVGMNLNYSVFQTGHLWQALAMGTQLGGVGSGSVTVTTLTSERVAGTFEFTAPAAQSSGASGTKVVTNGTFNVKFNTP